MRNRADLTSLQTVRAAAESLPRIRQREILSALSSKMKAGVALPAALSTQLRNPRVSEPTKAALCWLSAHLSLKSLGPVVLLAFREAKKSELGWESAKAIAQLRPTGATRVLAEKLNHTRSASLASAAAWALGKLKKRSAVGELLRYLRRDDTDPGVRGHVCEALGVLGDPRAVQALIDRLDDNAPMVRYWAAYALGVLGTREALPKLRQLARSDYAEVYPELKGHESVSTEARWAIQQIGRKRRARPK
jgi:HEAT repeat protein